MFIFSAISGFNLRVCGSILRQIIIACKADFIDDFIGHIATFAAKFAQRFIIDIALAMQAEIGFVIIFDHLLHNIALRFLKNIITFEGLNFKKPLPL